MLVFKNKKVKCINISIFEANLVCETKTIHLFEKEN